MFKIGICVDSTAILQPTEKGSSTEIALLKYITKVGVNYTEYREKYQPLFKYPFSSARKRMSVIVEIKEKNYIFVKGAS